MKQTKKLSRSQRNLLLKKKIPVEGVRVVNETKDCLTYQTSDGQVHRLEKT